MAVHKRGYQGYQGPFTPRWSRFLTPARYALRPTLDSRFLLLFLACCFVRPLVCAALIYLPYNAGALALFGISLEKLVPIDAGFFFRFLNTQGVLAFLLTAFVAPGLVAPDLANNPCPCI